MNATNPNSQLDPQAPDAWLAHLSSEELSEFDAHIGAMQVGDLDSQNEETL